MVRVLAFEQRKISNLSFRVKSFYNSLGELPRETVF
jgi:hypothetical protein